MTIIEVIEVKSKGSLIGVRIKIDEESFVVFRDPALPGLRAGIFVPGMDEKLESKTLLEYVMLNKD